nr:DNA cytosine methyltransferase [uncultured Eubacterium sp.]
MQGENLQPCVIGGLNDKKWGSQYHQQDRVYSSKGVAMCYPANIPGGSYKYMIQEKKYRIRKLTPKECWRLMGFTDEEFEKAAAVNSNTQLYKQAGNSIVVDVLVAIFSEMINSLEDRTPKYQHMEQMSLFDYV